MLHRRDFLFGAGALAVCGAAGVRLSATPFLIPSDGNARVLVLLQLSGGNDGLSTLVPYGDDAYGRARSATRIEASEVHKLDQRQGLHPELVRLAARYAEGQLAIVEGVGYAQPNRSHFKSMEIWHTADQRGRTAGAGWIARLAAQAFAPNSGPNQLVHIGGEVPYALHGAQSSPVSFSVPQGYRWVGDENELEHLAGLGAEEAEAKGHGDPADIKRAQPKGSSLDFVRGVMRDAHASSREVRAAAAAYRPSAEYPNSALGDALRAAAALVDARLGSRVISVEFSGFDTHNDQRARHSRQMSELDAALEAFLADIGKGPQRDQVALMAFSEFGRRVQENGSRGTDHGTAGPVLIAGSSIKGGFHGRTPSLTELDQGDLIHTTDFRSVYATLIDRWLGGRSELVLGAKYANLEFL